VVKAQDRNTTRNSITPRLQQNLNDFLQSLSDVLVDITALEVNTMVVDQITGHKFIPWQVYRDVYPISQQYLEHKGIHPCLRDRYLSLRKQLEIEYCLILVESDPTFMQDCRILRDPTVNLDEIQSLLPNPLNLSTSPAEVRKINHLLEDGRFLRSLRKIAELKAALDRRNAALNNCQETNPQEFEEALSTDLIYAQTVIQLDGDIINRFHKRLLEHDHKEIILQIHQEGVISGEKQWRGILDFIVGLVESMLTQRPMMKNLSRTRIR